MIFSNPIILASEFITHIILIVLMGMEVVVYVCNNRFKGEDNRKNRNAFNFVVVITLLGALWLLIEVLGVFSSSYFLFIRFFIIATIIAVVVLNRFASYRHHVAIHNSFAVWFSLLAGVFMLSDMMYIYFPTQLVGILYASSRIMAILAYYFFIMSYMIKINHEHQ